MELSDNEKRVITAIATNKYRDDDRIEWRYVPASLLVGCSGEKWFPGTMSGLVRKELAVSIDGHCALTKQGAAAYQEIEGE